LDDRISLNVNSTRASSSIAAGTSLAPRITPNSSRKLIEKCYSQNQYSLLFVTSKKSGSLGASRSVSYATATKLPNSFAFQRFSKPRDKILAPQFLDPGHTRATQLQ